MVDAGGIDTDQRDSPLHENLGGFRRNPREVKIFRIAGDVAA